MKLECGAGEGGDGEAKTWRTLQRGNGLMDDLVHRVTTLHGA